MGIEFKIYSDSNNTKHSITWNANVFVYGSSTTLLCKLQKYPHGTGEDNSTLFLVYYDNSLGKNS